MFKSFLGSPELSGKASGKVSVDKCLPNPLETDIGQAHHMFSRLLNLKFFSWNLLGLFCFSTDHKVEVFYQDQKCGYTLSSLLTLPGLEGEGGGRIGPHPPCIDYLLWFEKFRYELQTSRQFHLWSHWNPSKVIFWISSKTFQKIYRDWHELRKF